MRKSFSVVVSLFLVVTAILSATLSQQFMMPAFARTLATSPVLGNVASYSVLAGSGEVLAPSVIHDADAPAGLAQAANTAAFGALDQTCDVTYAGVQNLTLVSPLGPGVYCATSFSLSGNLTLIGSGVWVFKSESIKSESTVITSPSSSVTGGDPCNVWWRVGSSATLDTGTTFVGNILALTSITLNTGANLNGRALAQTGAVTMADNDISLVCAVNPGPTSTPTGTPAPTADDPVEEPSLSMTVYLPAIR